MERSGNFASRKRNPRVKGADLFDRHLQAADLIGRKVGFEQGATAFAVLDEVRKLEAALARSTNVDVAAVRDGFRRAVDGVASATQSIVDTFPTDPNAVAAVSVPYFRLWARSAAVGSRRARR